MKTEKVVLRAVWLVCPNECSIYLYVYLSRTVTKCCIGVSEDQGVFQSLFSFFTLKPFVHSSILII